MPAELLKKVLTSQPKWAPKPSHLLQRPQITRPTLSDSALFIMATVNDGFPEPLLFFYQTLHLKDVAPSRDLPQAPGGMYTVRPLDDDQGFQEVLSGKPQFQTRKHPCDVGKRVGAHAVKVVAILKVADLPDVATYQNQTHHHILAQTPECMQSAAASMAKKKKGTFKSKQDFNMALIQQTLDDLKSSKICIQQGPKALAQKAMYWAKWQSGRIKNGDRGILVVNDSSWAS